jgi:PIN domain nuclease of toxin-antitoxin system
MSYLIDTHVFIWFTENNLQLSNKIRAIIENEKNDVYISVTSFYEMAIKVKIGKLSLGKSLRACIDDAKAHNFFILPITENHITMYDSVPLIETHRDPFDRLIIATALYENLAILTADKQFDNYTSLVEIIH